MKPFRHLYLLLLLLLSGLVACSTDIADEQGGTSVVDDDGMVNVSLRIAVAGSNTAGPRIDTRVANDAGADDDELMNLWTVIVTDNDGNLVRILGANTDASTRAEDNPNYLLRMKPGEYHFYSFANITPDVALQLMGFTKTGSVRTRPSDDGSGDNNGNGDNNDPTTNTPDTTAVYTPTQTVFGDQLGRVSSIDISGYSSVTLEQAKLREVGVRGNGANPKEKNVFGVPGIPMSNVQTVDVKSDTEVSLVVVRMYAKVKLRLYNFTSSDLKVRRIIISDITSNTKDNIRLLPELSEAGSGTSDIIHADIKPKLGSGGKYKEDFVYWPTESTVKGNMTTTSTPVDVTFFLNECEKPVNKEGNRFMVTLELADASNNITGYRYALIDDSNKEGYTGTWNYIARNDYREIPLVIDDYRLELTPYEFPAIGVFPAMSSVLDTEKRIYEYTFKEFGHFHLVPQVKHGTDTDPISFTSTSPTTKPYEATQWGLIDDTWASSWSSYTGQDKGTKYTAEYNKDTGKFYEDVELDYPATDLSENGGLPVMTTGAWNGFSPYIFGKIAPHASGVGGQVYHEFKVNLYVKGESKPRVLDSRFYIVLDASHPTARPRNARCAH